MIAAKASTFFKSIRDQILSIRVPQNLAFAMSSLALLPLSIYFKLGSLFQIFVIAICLFSPLSLKPPLRAQFTIFVLLPLICLNIALHLLFRPIFLAIDEIRYYWGFLFIYPFLALVFWDKPLETVRLLKAIYFVLSITFLTEAVVVNIYPGITKYLLNYPDFAAEPLLRTRFFGFYQRPFGLNGSCTETTSLIAILLTFFATNEKKWSLSFDAIGLLAVLSGLSGAGIVFAIFYFVVRIYQSRYIYFLWPASFVLLLTPFMVTYLPTFSDVSPLWKVSFPYVSYLFDIKLKEFIRTLEDNKSSISYFLGNKFMFSSNASTWSDFGLANFISMFGFLGVGTLVSIIFIHARPWNVAALLFLFISTFHYASIFPQVGQLVFCLILISGLKNRPHQWL